MEVIAFYILLVVLVICIGWFIGTIRDIHEKVTYIEGVLKNNKKD